MQRTNSAAVIERDVAGAKSRAVKLAIAGLKRHGASNEK